MDSATIRSQFPITSSYAYFNNAAIAPLSRPAAEAMRTQVGIALQNGVHGNAGWVEEHAGLRDEAATMLGCAADEIAITKNTSEGLCAIANGLDWRSGDTVVGLDSDFPANYVPWRELQQRRGVRFRSLELRQGRLELDELDDELDQACNGARLAALSYVHFLTGFRWDLKAVGEICHRRGCLLVLDAVQGMGAFPIDVKACGVHALAASAHKWLAGPEGCGVLYVDRDVMPRIAPTEFGWASLEGFEQYRHDGGLHSGARRYECGTLNSTGCAGLRASLALLNRIGPDFSSRHIHALAEQLLSGALGKAYEAAAERSFESGSGIVSLRKRGVEGGLRGSCRAQLRERLGDRIAAQARRRFRRGRWKPAGEAGVGGRPHGLDSGRVAPHVYNSAAEIDRLVHLLP